MSTTVGMILKIKGSDVFTTDAKALLTDAIKALTERGIGAVVVADSSGAPIGVLSERDIVRALAHHGSQILSSEVAEFMTRDIITCTEHDTVDTVMELMTERRVRHVPVIQDGILVGLVSIGDVVKAKIAETEAEAEALKSYIAEG